MNNPAIRGRMMGGLVCYILCCTLLCLPLGGIHAQRVHGSGQRPTVQTSPALHGLNVPSAAQTRASLPGKVAGKKVTQYTAEEWKAWIDSTWGAGQSATQQLHVFDYFWDHVNTSWGGFPNLSLNWDSIRTLNRPQIGTGMSRGRFAALMSRVWMSLLEHHTYMLDMGVDTTFGSDNSGFWRYRAGVPLLVIGTQWWDLIGAPVTALPDSSGLVYRTAPGNPLGLQPGDIILGYEGVPWKQLFPHLLEMGVPVNRYWSSPGSTPESRTQHALSAVGWNWGMFDTIDVMKHGTGDTVHLPTAPLATATQTIWASDQVPVPGIPMPEGGFNNTNAVSWGVVEGTNIGYIYVWDWATSSTPQRFADAVTDLRYTRKVDGLVIDFRMNWGGEVGYANAGFAQLFGFDPTSNWEFLTRGSGSDHMSFTPITLNFGFTPSGTSFDHPIAMLIGPGCLSAGDYNAFRLRFHPMARSFGKATNGAFVAGSQQRGSLEQDWAFEYWPGLMSSRVPGEGYMIHKGVQPDESVWLTRDGVARGEDDVVKRAIEWITTLTYAHDVALDRHYAHPGMDSVCITAVLANPLHHTATLSAIVTDTLGAVRDSTLFFDDGLHGDGLVGDSVWGCYVPSPATEDIYAVNVRADDITLGTFRKLPNATGFTTAGPLTIDSLGCTFLLSRYIQIKPYIRNNGGTYTIRGARLVFTSRDPWVQIPATASLTLADIAPGTVATSTTGGSVTVRFDSTTCPGYVNLVAEMSVGGRTYWTDTTRVYLPGVGVEEQEALPTTFALHQNYPNPFNPSTTIKFELPKSSDVRLSVFDMLGREVSVLVNERRDAGVHEVRLDGSNLASGVYLYRLQTGDFLQTKRSLLLR